ncbi:hypothetical protein U1Q18_002637 [Sarracenia purpurea var. burkii]
MWNRSYPDQEKKGIRVWSSTSRQQPDPVSAKVGSAFGDATRTNQEKRRRGIGMLGSKPSTQASVTGCCRPTESKGSVEQGRSTELNSASSGDPGSHGMGGQATSEPSEGLGSKEDNRVRPWRMIGTQK